MFKQSGRILLITAVLLVLATATYAFAAANTVPTSYAGDGNNTISGYTVSNIHYGLASGDPTTIGSVTFTLNNPAAEVHVSLNNGTISSCTSTDTLNWSCAGLNVSAASAANLRVIAVQ